MGYEYHLNERVVGNPICVDYEGNSVFTIDGMLHNYLEEGYIGCPRIQEMLLPQQTDK